ncbi:histone deacetylase [Aeromicrobium sp. YIM 150415]|uniref:histone deacetylase n=1 Tax=Aeromicrobium sp. YIM 150415 TaxID=2803912 RepID=UPI001965B920|nr:histone deacetylase [Aeromicrobium sp. YIM 150415]MBM9464846.1 histone deacetylase [Aeromicrobium sp. YIM 150415]
MSEVTAPLHETVLPHHGDLVWYVSYGSNLAAERLRLYLEGGTPPGGARRNPGARDPRPPLASAGVELPGALYFAGESPQWGGGVAFYDHLTPGPTAARAYLVTAAQFVDIAAQEMHRVPREGDPLERVIVDGLGGQGARHEVGPGHYETLIEVGRRDGLPMLTFTAPHGRDAVGHAAPSPAYLAMLANGLGESHGWDEDRTAAYFSQVLPSV